MDWQPLYKRKIVVEQECPSWQVPVPGVDPNREYDVWVERWSEYIRRDGTSFWNWRKLGQDGRRTFPNGVLRWGGEGYYRFTLERVE